MADDIRIKVGVASTVKAGMDNVVKDVQSKAGEVSGAVKGMLAGISFAGILAGVRTLISGVSDLKDAAEQVDFSTRNFQILKAVASDAGVGVDSLSGALSKLSKAQTEAGDNKTTAAAFTALGISISEVEQLAPDALLERIAAGFAKTGDKAALFDLFGKSANKLIPTLRQLSGGFDALANREDIISDEDIAKIDEMDDSLNKLLRTVTALAARGLSALGDKLGEWRDGGWTPAQGEINKGMRDRLAAIKQESDTAAETEIKHGIETSATEAALMSGPTKEQAAAYDKENKDRLASMAAEDQARLSDQQKSSDLERSMAEQRAKQKQEYTDKKTKDAEEKKKQQDEKMRDAIAARRELLQDAVARGEGAQERIDSARTGREYKNVMAAEREQKRKDDRENKLADIALDNAGRRKLNKREEALLAGIGDKRAAEDAKKELAKMDAEAKKATIAAAASLSNIERDIKGVLVMKGN